MAKPSTPQILIFDKPWSTIIIHLYCHKKSLIPTKTKIHDQIRQRRIEGSTI